MHVDGGQDITIRGQKENFVTLRHCGPKVFHPALETRV